MPIYEYRCLDCGAETEVIQKSSDTPIATCETCAGRLQKLISQSAFQFRGSGWYVTDYARKAKGDNQKPGSGDAKGAEGSKSEAKPSGSATSDSASTKTDSAESRSTSAKSESAAVKKPAPTTSTTS